MPERLTSHTLVLHCSVQDTGSGMSSERLSEIMALTPDTRQIDHGLGLAICRRLVELMHGEFSADSSPGVGSDFRVSVKLGQTHHGAEVSPRNFLRHNAISRCLSWTTILFPVKY